MSNQPCTAGAKRRPHGELSSSLCAAREQHIRHIDARDRQQKHHGTEHGEQRRPDAARHVCLQGCRDQTVLQICPRHARKLRQRHVRDLTQLPSGLIDADTGSEARHHPQVVSPLSAVGTEHGVVLQRCPELRQRRQDILESVRQHADDEIWRVVERDGAADDRPIALEAPPPKSVAEDGDVRSVRSIVVHLEVTANEWRHAQRAEKVGADPLTGEPLRLAVSNHRRLPRFERGDRLEHPAPLRELAIRAERHISRLALRAGIRDHRDALGVRVRQRFEQDWIDRAEDRRGCADA